MTETTHSSVAQRMAALAGSLRADGAILSPAVEAAFAAVPRHRFLPSFRYRADEYRLGTGTIPDGQVLDLIYANNALVTRVGQDDNPPSSSSAPGIMARMLEAAGLRPGHRVLEIGAGTGYNAALIHHITGGEVVTVEAGRLTATEATGAIRDAGLQGQVHVVHGDGHEGYAKGGPYDRIIVTCGVAGIPRGWLAQVADDARIVAPVAHAGVHPIMLIDCQPGRLLPSGRVIRWGDFMPAVGRLRPGGMFGHDPAIPVPVSAAVRVSGVIPPLDQASYQDLWCYLGTRDKRITRAAPDTAVFDPAIGMCALTDPHDGTAWVHMDGSVTRAGCSQVAAQLADMASQWNASRPPLTRWQAGWNHGRTGECDLLVPDNWTLRDLIH